MNRRLFSMMAYRFAAVALLAVFASAPVLAQDSAPTQAPAAAAAPAKPVKERKSCRTEDVIGSTIPHSTCHTKAEWDAIDHADRDNARDLMSRVPPRG
jgi:hypothetical protein